MVGMAEAIPRASSAIFETPREGDTPDLGNRQIRPNRQNPQVEAETHHIGDFSKSNSICNLDLAYRRIRTRFIVPPPIPNPAT
jgi:hypothetical protein